MTTTEEGARRAWAVLDHIEARPELWDQGVYIELTDCGRKACFAGWTVLLFGQGEPRCGNLDATAFQWMLPTGEVVNIDDYADRLLGAKTYAVGPDGEMENLYSAYLTLDDLRAMVTEIFGARPEVAP